MFVYIGCQGSDHGHGLCTPDMRHPTAVDDTRHAWVHKDRSTMADRTLYELMGLRPNASLESIKSAFRTLAKQYHPDKNSSPDATKAFQKLNTAYQTLVSFGNDRGQEDNGSDSSVAIALPNVTLITRENTFSITIDIIDIIFLVFMEECELHHNVRPVDRGSNGIQFRFDYTSPDDAENYGILSLTFYATTSRLLVQGTSYLRWVDEHLPLIYKRAESRYTEDLGTNVYAVFPLDYGQNNDNMLSNDTDLGFVVLYREGNHYDACVKVYPHPCCRQEMITACNAHAMMKSRSSASQVHTCKANVKNAPRYSSSGKSANTAAAVITTSGDQNEHAYQDKNEECHAQQTAPKEHDLFSEVTNFRNGLPCNFIFTHININSFRHKFVYISDILREKQVDYLAISETKRTRVFQIRILVLEIT